MTEVTLRELRDHGGEVVSRVAQGEQITVTRAGQPVAELRPAADLLDNRRATTHWHYAGELAGDRQPFHGGYRSYGRPEGRN